MAKWKRLSASEANALLNEQGQANRGPHRLDKRVCHWAYCSRCGLVDLNNAPTRKAMRKECVIYV